MILDVFVQKEYENYIITQKDKLEHDPQEDDYGNTEYKLKLVNPSQDKLQHRTTQMKFRLQEGSGEAKYMIGLEDDGTPTGLSQEEMLQSLSI